ncbi:hypothetical protein KC220_27050, partial [Mycobacterium tuberculosis]|nr:hypothetical protein [Mycobacterium tuberculosis]
DYWSGLYLGLHAGVGGGTTDYPYRLDVIDPVLSARGAGHMDGSGWLAGGQIGYNWVLPSRVLLGLEADIGWSSIEDQLKL